MNLAIEYLTRTNLIKDWLEIPISLFLYNKEIKEKVVITINEELEKSDYYCVKKWKIDDCDHCSLPPIIESRVLKKDLYTSPNIILPGYSLLAHHDQFVFTYKNSYKQPMSYELYNHFCDQIVNGIINNRTRMNWLWRQFIRVNSINLYSREYYISSVYCSEDDLANEQRNIVCKNMKKEWECWRLWQESLLLNPGELFFYKEYSEQ